MNADAPNRNRTLLVVIAVAVAVIAVATVLLIVTRDSGEGNSQDYATSETLTKDGAVALWSRWQEARKNCDMTEMQAVASSAFLAQFRVDNGEATSNAQACSNNQAHARFKSVTNFESVGEPEFTDGSPPTLTLESKVTTADNLLGENTQVSYKHRAVTFVRGSDGYWRVDNSQWIDW